MAVKKNNSERDAENKKLGKLGEKKACGFLRKNGYKIVKKNYVNPFGEVDIIAQKKDVTAFVEVKTRLSDIFGTPAEAVNRARRKKYVQAAKYYFAGKEIDCTVRFDIIEIFRGQINHIENAFYPEN
ncbi:MAG: YraN family protein [Clostridia bacterium]|nr:YraN family protein [Clostridia bacterium]